MAIKDVDHHKEEEGGYGLVTKSWGLTKAIIQGMIGGGEGAAKERDCRRMNSGAGQQPNQVEASCRAS